MNMENIGIMIIGLWFGILIGVLVERIIAEYYNKKKR